MLTDTQLRHLLSDIESDRIERTISTNNTDKFAEAVCAFANDFPNHQQPGYLFIGVNDNGVPVGMKVTDELLRNLSALRDAGNIQPLPALTVQKYVLGEGEVAVVEVMPSDLPPVRYKGRICIRVGPRKAIANETEERILSERRTSLSKTFDARPCIGSKLDDLALDIFAITYRIQVIAPEILAENHRSETEQLASLRFFDLSRNCPTFAGMILFARDPLNWLPGAYIQFIRFNGSEITDEVINEVQLSGDLLTVLRELDRFIPTQVQTHPVTDSALREQLIQDYPILALRELFLNAVLHRSYESNSPIRIYWFTDRVEIQNPGGLYGEATPENFPRQNAYRNPIIAEALKALGYVNRFGRGVYRAQKALADNGNSPARFDFQSTFVSVTLYRRP